MYAAGILVAENRVELVDGQLIEMNPPGPRHSERVQWLHEHFMPATRGRLGLRVQDALVTADRGFLVPDLLIFEPIPAGRMLDTALLVVEVAQTSRSRDLGKTAAYAACGVTEYWVVDIDRDDVLVHREPRDGGYEVLERFVPGHVITALIDVPPVDVSALLAR